MSKGSFSNSIPDLTDFTLGVHSHQYRILGIIANGHWGRVFRAERVDKPDDLQYAVKFINRSALNPFEKQLISDEVHLQTKCSKTSQRVLQVHDVIEVDFNGLDLLCIVTEYCDNGDLFSLVYGSIDAPDSYVSPLYHNDDLIRDIFLQTIDAVADCHALGVYHRDLKPENILLRRDGSVALCDFGYATTKPSTMDFGIGTGPYVSPEITNIFHNEEILTGPADIWALGIILVNLIQQDYPWSQASLHDRKFDLFLTKPKKYFIDFLDVSTEVNAILGRIFTKYPEDRIELGELRERVANVKTFYAPRTIPKSISTSVLEIQTPTSDLYKLSPSPSLPINLYTTLSTDSDDSYSIVVTTDSDYDSVTDLEEPITPETKSVQLVVVNPDEPCSFDLDGPATHGLKSRSRAHGRFLKRPESIQNLEACIGEKSPHDVPRMLTRSISAKY